ncbi:MAG: PspC domain-containing protein [Burkholderiales bacterium]|nr:PspC domain-containing protein [Burkholderiales bacterium]
MSMSDEIEKLHRLHGQGALTDEEFSLAKKRLIDGLQPASERTQEQSAQRSYRHESPMNEFKLSNSDRWIGGVAGGLAELTQIPAWTWRILFVLLAFLHGVGVLMYILLWIFVPRRANPVAARAASSAQSGTTGEPPRQD